MAGEWMPVRLDIHEDPAVIGIAQRLNIDEDTVVGKLTRIWSWFSRNSEDGTVKLSPAWIDKLARLEGFSEAMVAVDWLELGDELICMPRFDNWLSEGAKRRLKKTLDKKIGRCRQDVASLSPNGGDKTATTGEERTLKSSSGPDPSANGQGAGGNPSGSGAFSAGSVYAKLDDASIASDDAVLNWLDWQATKDSAVIRTVTEKERRFVLAVARQCRSEAKKPVAKFVSMISKGTLPKQKYLKGVEE